MSSSRRLESGALRRAFARGPRSDLDFLVPAREPAAEVIAPAPSPAAPAAELEPVVEARPRKATSRRKPAARRTRAQSKPEVATPPIEAVAPPPSEAVAPIVDVWAPATAPWPEPTLGDRLLRRVERLVLRVLFRSQALSEDRQAHVQASTDASKS